MSRYNLPADHFLYNDIKRILEDATNDRNTGYHPFVMSSLPPSEMEGDLNETTQYNLFSQAGKDWKNDIIDCVFLDIIQPLSFKRSKYLPYAFESEPIAYKCDAGSAKFSLPVSKSKYILRCFLDEAYFGLIQYKGVGKDKVTSFIRKNYLDDYIPPIDDVASIVLSHKLFKAPLEPLINSTYSNESYYFASDSESQTFENLVKEKFKQKGLNAFYWWYSRPIVNLRRNVFSRVHHTECQSFKISPTRTLSKRPYEKEITSIVPRYTWYIGGEKSPFLKENKRKEPLYSAFLNDKVVERVFMFNDVKELREKAFAGCSSLKEINLSKGLTVIGKEAFKDCVSLEKLVIPNKVKSIHPSAFDGCINLQTIEYLGNEEEWKNIMYVNDPSSFGGSNSLVKIMFVTPKEPEQRDSIDAEELKKQVLDAIVKFKKKKR